MTDSGKTYKNIDECVAALIERVGKDINLGIPLGLGKPVHLVNALYRRAKEDPSLRLHIQTAISLEKPHGSSSLEKKFMGPFAARVFEGVPDLDYVLDLRRNQLPVNVQVSEFFFKAGSFLNTPSQQQNYVSSNYTHAVRDLIANGVNVVAQMIARRDIDGRPHYSLSCNTDLGLDIVPLLRQEGAKGRQVAVLGEVNRQLPFMQNHAVVPSEDFDFIFDNPKFDYALFPAPLMAISPADHMIGFYASTLVRDGGTLQVGIGSLGSALVYSSIVRHQHNELYRELAAELEVEQKFPLARSIGGFDPFAKGLYGCSEMMVDGFLHLYRAGILKREVYDDERLQRLINEERIGSQVDLAMLDALVEAGVIASRLRAKDVAWLIQHGIFRPDVEYKGGSLVVDETTLGVDLEQADVRHGIQRHCLGTHLSGGILMHGGFFLGPRDFYQALRDLSDVEQRKFCMTSVNFINHLYDHRFGDQKLKQAQRQEGRFINSTMMVTLQGAAISDGLANGKVVSGVGGQYNFVAMAHELPDARSILKLKSTRISGGKPVSNILFNYGYTTIPRHLRDIYITEYGIADVRGKADKDVYIELIKIADSRFQESLLAQAKAAGKIPRDYQLPPQFRHNTPERLQAIYRKYAARGFFPPFPFGCEFTEEELVLGKALKSLKHKSADKLQLLKALWRAYRIKDIPDDLQPLLARMSLEHPRDFREKIEQRLLVAELMGSRH